MRVISILSLVALSPLLSPLPSLWSADGTAGLHLADEYAKPVAEALGKSGKNGVELRRALTSVEPEMREGMQFLIANMPDEDLKSLQADFLLGNIRLAYRTRQLPWARAIEDELFLNDVLPYASIDERRDDWRGDFYKRFLPVVKDCQTPGEVAHKLNQEIFGMVGVKYSTQRKKANQSPYESMDIGLASCTGLSVLLTDACRAVGVPARLAGTPLWMNKRGNHTWVEVWDGSWKIAGAAEPSGNGLDHAWFLGQAAEADNSQWQHRIYATSFRKTEVHFPLVWDMRNRGVPAVNVTESYHRFGKPAPAQPPKDKPGKAEVTLMIQMLDRPGGKRVAVEVTVSSENKLLKRGMTPEPTHDANRFFEVAVSGEAMLTIGYEDAKGVGQTRQWSAGKGDGRNGENGKSGKDGGEKGATGGRVEHQLDLYLSE